MRPLSQLFLNLKAIKQVSSVCTQETYSPSPLKETSHAARLCGQRYGLLPISEESIPIFNVAYSKTA